MFQASSIFGVENNQQFIFVLGILVFVTLVASLIFKAITTYVQIRFVQMCEYGICKRLVEGYLHQPYSWFLNRNSSEIGKTVLSEVSMVISRGLSSIMNLISQSISIIMMLSLLIYVNPEGPTCHKGTDSCWGEKNEDPLAFLNELETIISQRKEANDSDSYVASLFRKGINKIAQKVGEEAVETVIEAKDDNAVFFLDESADLLFHYLILLQAKGYTLNIL